MTACPDIFDLQLRSVPNPEHAAEATMADTAHQTLCLADGVAMCISAGVASCYDTCCATGSRLC
jgi:hypothetical protein